MAFDAALSATAIGSFPHRDVSRACELVLTHFPQIPVWPQLPATGLLEQMEIQYSEGLPCLVIDREKQRMYFDTSGDPTKALEIFYESYLSGNLDYFAMSPEYARGILAMSQRLQQLDKSEVKYFKMQVTGPISFGLTIVDENKRAIYYNDLFRDAIVKGLTMKARWQMRIFKPFFEKRICFIDEPILSAFGSSTYLSVKREDVVGQLAEVVQAIQGEGGLAGIHCCGNTEWTIPIDAGVDIINFDAYSFGDSLGLYPDRIKAFLKNGGVIAWGIVPTSEKIYNETTDSLIGKFSALLDSLALKGIDREMLWSNSLITPSCGTGSVPEERSEKICQQTKLLSDALRGIHAE
jgi:hypothetical protein